jgi:hypothetical protein
VKNGPKQLRPNIPNRTAVPSERCISTPAPGGDGEWRTKTNAVSRKLARAGPPRRHAVEQPVSHHQRVKRHGPKMGEEGEKQEIGKKRVHLPQGRVQYRTLRKDGKKMHRPVHDERIPRRRQHSPADQRLQKQQAVQQNFRCRGHHLFPWRNRRRKGGQRVQAPVYVPDDHQNQDQNPQRQMDGHQFVVIAEPAVGDLLAIVYEARRRNESAERNHAFRGAKMSGRATTDQQQFPGSMRFLHWLMAAAVLAMLGIGVAMVASLGKGSLDGTMPAGKTSGSKLMSRAGLVSSLSTESSVSVPMSTCSRASGHWMVALSVASPSCATVMTKCHCKGRCWMLAISPSKRKFLSWLTPVPASYAHGRERPAHVGGRAVRVDESKRIETVVGGVVETGRPRIALDDCERPYGFRVAREERRPFRRIGLMRVGIALRCYQVIVKGLRILEREHRQIDHRGPPLFAVGQRKLKPQAADGAQIVGGVGVADAQGKAADHWHAAALEDDSLREARPLPVAFEKSSNAYAFRVIATETRVDAVHPLKLIDEPRRRQLRSRSSMNLECAAR